MYKSSFAENSDREFMKYLKSKTLFKSQLELLKRVILKKKGFRARNTAGHVQKILLYCPVSHYFLFSR